MMVSDDKIQHHTTCWFSGRESANARVDTNHQAHAFSCGALNDVVFHSVAIADTVRNVEGGTSAEQVKSPFQDYDRRGAIYVVIAVDKNQFIRCNRLLN